MHVTVLSSMTGSLTSRGKALMVEDVNEMAAAAATLAGMVKIGRGFSVVWGVLGTSGEDV